MPNFVITFFNECQTVPSVIVAIATKDNVQAKVLRPNQGRRKVVRESVRVNFG